MPHPALSRWGSVRLPWPCFGKPLCDPGQSVFPRPVLTWAVPSRPAHALRNAPADTEHAPHHPGLPATLVPPLRTRFAPPRCLGPARNRPVPRVPSPAGGVTPSGRMARILSASVTWPSSLLRTHAPVRHPPAASVGKPCATGLCRLPSAPAGRRTFPTLSLRIFPRMPGPLPRRPPRCMCSFLPLEHRPSPHLDRVGSPQPSVQRLQYGPKFRGCSHSLLFRPPGLLALQIAPTAGPRSATGRPGL